jgi:glutathione synthase/RimK-type ligase-like ATP-grasp enzyme
MINNVCYPEVLFITNKDDFATDYLIYKFRDNKIPYFRVNSEDITEYIITYSPETTTLIIDDTHYYLSEVRSVYFRRAPTIFPKAINLEDTNFLNKERRDFLEGIFLTLKAKWINPLYPTYIGERKLFQLNLARKMGFKIPNTISSNRPTDIISFMQTNKNCIIKPISQGLQITTNGVYSIYTSSINESDIKNKEHLFESPILVQERINNSCDIRVTVVNNDIFSVAIKKDKPDEVDWRSPDIIKKYTIHELPQELALKILDLNKELNLTYSAMDFILTPDNEYFFLEVNPVGEWVWLEKELNLPISEAIIKNLKG